MLQIFEGQCFLFGVLILYFFIVCAFVRCYGEKVSPSYCKEATGMCVERILEFMPAIEVENSGKIVLSVGMEGLEGMEIENLQ